MAWAWGPNPDRTFRGAERVEFVVTAGEGGKGFIEIDDLTLRTLPPEPSVPPRPLAEATSEDGNSVASLAVDDDALSAWKSEAAGEQSLTLDLGYEREFGGLTLRWAEGHGGDSLPRHGVERSAAMARDRARSMRGQRRHRLAADARGLGPLVAAWT